MAATLFLLPQFLNSATQVQAGAVAYFYQTGTTTDQTVYTESTLTTPHDQPVVADANGVFPSIYLDSAAAALYKVVVKDSTEATTFLTVDPITNLLFATTATATELNENDRSAQALSNYALSLRHYTYNDGGATEPNQFSNVHTAVTVDTWESFGPTGSGADNIWTAMDVLPSDAKYVKFIAQVSVGGDAVANGPAVCQLYGRPGNTTWAAGDDVTIAYAHEYVLTGVAENAVTFTPVELALDPADLTFDLRWTVLREASEDIQLFFVGFGC